MREMRLVWPVIEGGAASLCLPDPMTAKSIDEFEEACGLVFRGARRRAAAVEKASAVGANGPEAKPATDGPCTASPDKQNEAGEWERAKESGGSEK